MVAFTRHRSTKLKIVPYRHHHYRWTITGHYVNGKRVRRFFPTKGEAETFLNQLRVKRENLGNRATAIDQRLHVMAVDATDRLKPYGQTIAGAVEFYIRHTETAKRSCSVEQLTEMLLATKKAEGKNAGYITAMRSIFKRFCTTFRGRLIAEITAAEIDDWLRAIPLEPLTRNNHRRVVSMLFTYGVLRDYCSANPMVRVPKAKVLAKPVGILTPEQTRQLLEIAPECLRPALAIGAFAGLRQAEILRLDWSEVHLDRNFIEVTAEKSKTATRRLVTILPNLKSWLQGAPQSGPLYPTNGRKLTDKARLSAGLADWPPNALRHSFASYHLAKFQDAAGLALQMGHTTTAMLFAHYREVVTFTDAEQYWNVVPQMSSP
ncbi:MAG TPA: tyrosine-type recombinase/integrase [Bryobacteraceae bacterium]|jgi:integrase